MNENNVIIKTEGVKVNFGDFWALKGIDIEVKRGEIIVILGPSGSGKSTFIRTLNRLQPHSGGSISVNGIEMGEKTSVADLKKIRAD
ncbi:MAG: ATP-binding cassette domain-containing protein, partial [Candidatus Thermoplasmatota archaeon]|nr:ATP-binding cassette domain-containing protein [Candidatus Thermoplasmatota archaeon]